MDTPNPPIDEARPPRAAETLDAVAVHTWLAAQVPDLAGAAAPEVLQFPGGASNLTYLLRYGGDPPRELVLRRPPFGARARSAHDVLREARLMRALRPHYPVVPEIVALCDDPGPLGCDFYVMERLRGTILRRELPAALALTPEQTRQLCLDVLDRQIALHAVDWRAAGLAGLGQGEGYARRQIDGWTRRYRDARTPDVPDLEGVMAWLDARAPQTESAICLIHNDFRFDNVVLDASAGGQPRVIGVLDWELATLGDPLMDLGSSLAYWIGDDDPPGMRALRNQPTHAPGMLTRAEVIAHYAKRTGRGVDDFRFYLVYGLFRLAGILQQIFKRYTEGHAANPEFAKFGRMVGVLAARCDDLMAGGKV